jgi:hypothetical protein
MTPLSQLRDPTALEALLVLGVPVLLVGLRDAASSNEFRTATHPTAFRVPSMVDALGGDGTHIAPLVKSDRNPYANFIFVGRSSTSDVVLRDGSVSKTHAVFEHDVGAGRWDLRDNRSHNGTWVDGIKLRGSVRVPLTSGAAILFGSYPAYLIMHDDLRRLLGALASVHA